jgi:hypothetical protein
MSISDFQQALARLVMSPPFRSSVRGEPDTALEAFDLSTRERQRLTVLANDPALNVGTMIHRSFRLSMLATTLSKTCAALGPQQLKEVVHRYWETYPPQDYYYEREAFRFGEYLLALLREGRLENEYVEQVLNLELNVLALKKASASQASESNPDLGDPAAAYPALNPLCRVVPFDHDPETLLTALSQDQVPEALPRGEHYLLLDRSASKQIQIRRVDPRLGAVLQACDGQASAARLCERSGLALEDLVALREAGTLVFYDQPQSPAAQPWTV